MKRAAAKRHIAKRDCILLAVAAAGLLLVAYAFVSLLAWRDIPTVFSGRQKALRSEASSYFAGPTAVREATEQRYDQLRRDTGQLCAVPKAIRWQATVVPSWRQQIVDCRRQQARYEKVIAQYYAAVRFTAAETHFARILRDVQTDSLAQEAWNPREQEQRWRTAAGAIRDYDTPEQLRPTQRALQVTMEGVADAWAAAATGNTRFLPSRYDQLSGVQIVLADDRRLMTDLLQAQLASL